MVFRAGNTSGSVNNHGRPGRIGVAFAPSWREPFERKSEQPIFSDVMEDPGLFIDEHGELPHRVALLEGRTWRSCSQPRRSILDIRRPGVLRIAIYS